MISFLLLLIAANAVVIRKVVFVFFFPVVLCMYDERESERF